MSDWLAWHASYDDGTSALAERLGVVRGFMADAIAEHGGRTLRVVSVCAGDGRDVLPVLGQWRLRKEISGRLIELEPRLAERARAAAESEQLGGIEVVCGDATRPTTYDGAIPADLVVLCGVFGNISDQDVARLIETLPTLCAAGANVVWTRHRRHPDLTPRIREWFAANGFEELAFSSPGPDSFSVGRNTLARPGRDTTLRDPLFTFTR